MRVHVGVVGFVSTSCTSPRSAMVSALDSWHTSLLVHGCSYMRAGCVVQVLTTYGPYADA